MEEYQHTIAQTIVQQLGGRKFTTMTGAKLFADINKSGQVELRAKLPGNLGIKNNINMVTIALNEGLDLYIMAFINTRKVEGKQLIKKYEQVYCDDLIPFFEEETGLYCYL
jgi:hypothetical protein